MKEKTTPLYDELKPMFDRFSAGDNKALFVFTNAWGELNYYPVSDSKYAWSEHDRITRQADTGKYAIMAFDLTREFDDQFSKERHGHLQREGLNIFSYNPLINIADKTGVIPAEEAKKKEHRMLYANQISCATKISSANGETPQRQKFIPQFVK